MKKLPFETTQEAVKVEEPIKVEDVTATKDIGYVSLVGVVGLTVLGLAGIHYESEIATTTAVTGIAASVTRIYK
jgi:hypothetical protein